MKQVRLVCLLTAGFFYLLCGETFCQDLAKDGKSNAEIVIESKGKSLTLDYAGEEFAFWTGRISGAELPVADTAGNAPVKVYLGTPESSKTIAAFAKPDVMKKLRGNDGFAIDSDGKNIYIYADCPKGVLNGVYRFLEKSSDIIFVRPMQEDTGFGTIFGTNPNLRSDIKNHVEIPAFSIRQFWGKSKKYEARLLCAPVNEFWNIQGAKNGVTWETSAAWIRASIQGKEHPEYFAERNGKRVSGWYGQLCFSNKELQKYYQDRLEDVFKASPAKLKYFGVNHSDNWDVCMCAECTKPIKLPNGKVVNIEDDSFRSTQFFLFYDGIMKNLERKYPDRQLRAFAYIWSAPPPEMEISKNILVEFAPYVKDHKVPIYDPRNKPWNERAEKWLKTHKNIMLFEYYLCTTTPLFPNPVGDVAALDLRYYAKSRSVAGMLQDSTVEDSDEKEANANAKSFTSANVFDMSAIEYWVISRLYWNPEQDPEKLRDEYCRRAYREAAEPMRKFYSTIREAWHKDSVACYWNDEPVMSTRRYAVETKLAEPLKKLLAEAEAKAVHPGSKELIIRARAMFEKLLELESKLPPKTTTEVPYCEKVPSDSFDFESGAWKNAAVIDQFRVRNNHHEIPATKTVVKVLHDRSSIYLAFDCRDESEKNLDALRNKGLTEKDVWPDEPSIELFFDGDLRAIGGYYQLAFNAAGSRYDGKGYDAKYNNDAWTVKGEIGKDSWKAIVKIPLESFGCNITMGNKFSMMIYRPKGNASWMGGNVHQPGGFQELLLKMN